ncbi:MAG: tetratricopeptide repeat protein [Bacteroidia bacterium]
MKIKSQIFLLFVIALLAACSGTKKYFKAAERLEKQGLVNEAAEYYLESLQRKPTNVQARIKLKEVGQKHVSSMSSEFFRDYNTQQLEASLESFERMKEFAAKTSALSVVLDYPKSYEDDYQKAVETFCLKNYNQAYAMVNQKKYNEAISYIQKIKKYNPGYKTTAQLEVVAVCEPLYQNAITCIENKNYSGALNLLTNIKAKTESYKDMQDLLTLASAQQTKSFILFAPKSSGDATEKEIEDYLFNNFNQVASQKFEYAKIINNTPFTTIGDFSSGTNVDMIQAIRKATGADYFYSYDISDHKEFNSGPQKTHSKAFLKETVVSGTVITTNYLPVDYSNVKASRSYSYVYNYKLINAYTNQIVSSQNLNVVAQDAIEYNEFARNFNSNNINNLFPYNPNQTPVLAQYNASKWRQLFTANANLKSFDVLKTEANNQAINLFSNSVLTNIK